MHFENVTFIASYRLESLLSLYIPIALIFEYVLKCLIMSKSEFMHIFFQSMMKILLNKIMGNEGVEDFEAVEDAEAGIDGKISKG